LTSSTAPSERTRALFATLAACALAWLVAAVALEATARFVEERLGAYLWVEEEWMQWFTPGRYAPSPEPAVLVLGPSEAREAFWPEPFRARLGARLLNESLSMSSFEDGVTQLELIEASYGRGTLGRWLVVAVTPRFLLGFTPGERPLPIALARYHPELAIDESVEPQRLVPKSPLGGIVARVRFVGHAGKRYRRALRTLALAARDGRGGDWEGLLRANFLVSSRYHAFPAHDKAEYYAWTAAGKGVYEQMRHMRAEPRRETILRDFARIREIAERNGARVLVVNLPEGGWLRRGFYDPGVYESYRAVLAEAAGELPLLDLREALPDDAFYDWNHPTYAASLQLSERVAAWIAESEGR
jgi:hypothetical protein